MSEERPEPLEMSDTEILDWMNEYCSNLQYYPADAVCREMFEIECYQGMFFGNSIREVIQVASAKQREMESV